MDTSRPSGRHVVLVGMMGTGKTTVGRAVARQLGRPFLDSDLQVEARTRRSVREIFETEGEAVFRRLESEALADAVNLPEPVVIAAAGGVVLDLDNRALLRKAGTVVWLRARPETLVRRVRPGDHRPLLADDPLGVLTLLADQREDLYREVTDVVVDVDGRDRDDVIAEIVKVAT